MYITDHDTLRRANAELLTKHGKSKVNRAINEELAAQQRQSIGYIPTQELAGFYAAVVKRLAA